MLSRPYSHIISSFINRFLLLSCLVLMMLTVLQDYLQSTRNETSFYLSESILFSTFWLIFIPGLFLMNRMMHMVSLRRIPSIIVLLGIITSFHLIGYAVAIYGISALLFDHTYSITQTLSYGISTLLLSCLLIYGFAGIAILKWPRPPKEFTRRIKVKIRNEIKSIEVNDIIFIQSESPYVSIHIGNQQYLDNSTLKSMAKQLDPSTFVRIHKSTIINLDHMKSYSSRQNGDYDVEMNDGSMLRLSRNFASDFKKRM